MSNVAIRVDNLGKRYRLGTAAKRHDSLREALVHGLQAPLRNLSRLRKLTQFGDDDGASADTVWALRHVSFDVPHGEVLGIVGRNGAGKSTLLKILSRITSPSTGRAEIHGRVGSLLEVGTGFHAELTGRDNVYLNGSILGMDRAFITRRFDEIVEFAGVEKFIDTPVKHYSSGMYLRLAFAVAAHLEPEILIVDEVLAVGDAEFQKKCVGKMGQVSREGRTVLFVSHNMGAVRALCRRGVLLTSGTKTCDGDIDSVLQSYLATSQVLEGERRWADDEAPGDKTTRLRGVSVQQPVGTPTSRVDMEQPFRVEVDYEVAADFPELNVTVEVHDSAGGTVLLSTHSLDESGDIAIGPGRYRSICEFPANALNAGRYLVSVAADEPNKRIIWVGEHVLQFHVETTDPAYWRYPLGSYRGSMGPRSVTWTRYRTDDAPVLAAR